MRTLRPHLDRARDDYRLAQYPGDLASELLPERRSRLWRLLPVFITGAIAATILVVLRPGTTPTQPPATPIASILPVETPSRNSNRPYQFAGKVPFTLPVTPLMPLPPVAVSLTWIPQDLSQQSFAPLQQSYEAWMQRFIRHAPAEPTPALPEKGSFGPTPIFLSASA